MSLSKIIKSGGAEPEPFEASIAQAILELETNSDLKSNLRELYITKAREVETNNKKVRYISFIMYSSIDPNTLKFDASFNIEIKNRLRSLVLYY